jgi:hypothetical protein
LAAFVTCYCSYAKAEKGMQAFFAIICAPPSASTVLATRDVWGYVVCMKVEKIKQALHAQPFRPFFIHLADGGRLPVMHEDFVALEPAGREIIVYLRNNTHQIIDVLMITRLEVGVRNGARKPRH